MNLKRYFPIYKKYPKLAYLDSSATALKPQVVVEAMTDYLSHYSANIHRGLYQMSEQASSAYDETRKLIAEFLGTKDEGEIVFTRGTTEGINLIARTWGETYIKPGDEIVTTQMEHHVNIVPWQVLANKTGAKLRFAKINDHYLISNDQWEQLINKKTKLVAITHESNVLGTINPIAEITAKIKAINPTCVVVVDGAQIVAHQPVNVVELGCDFYVFSGHKMYASTGVGVLWGKRELLEAMPTFMQGGAMIREVGWQETVYAPLPDKFEAGTMPIAEVISLGAAIRFMKSIGWKTIQEQEGKISALVQKRLGEIDGLKIFGPSDLANRGGVFSFAMEGVHAHDIAQILDETGVCVRAGHHCAMPLHGLLKVDSSTRVSVGMYSDEKDIEGLIVGLQQVKKIFYHG